MKRRMSALTATAAALPVAAGLLTGCTTDSHPGSAAVVGDEKITVAQVQARVETIRSAQRAEENADQLIANSGSLPRDTVHSLVVQELLERTAEEQGVTVTRREVRQAREQFEANFESPEDLEQFGLYNEGAPFTVDQLDDLLRNQLLIGKLSERVGEGQVGVVVGETAERLGVEINPRYGEWDAEMSTLTDPDMPWLNTGTDDTAEILPG